MKNVNDKKECEEHTMVEKTMDKIVALAKSRGFVYPGSEIYGGLANTWDYGRSEERRVGKECRL